MKGISRFGQGGKLSLRYLGSFVIFKRVGNIAYKLVLPTKLSYIQNIFHISMLKKYIIDSM